MGKFINKNMLWKNQKLHYIFFLSFKTFVWLVILKNIYYICLGEFMIIIGNSNCHGNEKEFCRYKAYVFDKDKKKLDSI